MRPMILSLAAAASTVALTQIASAADLGQPIDGAPPPPPALVYSWTGLYAGVNAGLGWENTINNAAIPIFCNPIDTTCPAWAGSAAAVVPQKFDTHPLGFIGGGQIGYNLQFASAWVAGIEADFQGANIKGDAIVPNAEPIPSAIPGTVTNTGTGSQKLDWLGTVRGRVGWLPVNPLLLYATGGLAYGHVQTAVSFHNQTFSAFCGCFTTDGSVSASDTTTRAGWTVGGGLEWMIAPNWSLKGEYLYYDLGRVTLNSVLDQNGVPGNVLFTAVAIRSEAFFHGSIARVGLNYRFSPATDPGQQPAYEPPPPLPEPVYDRTGFYAGLNAGGGWENTINNTATTGFCNIV